MSDRCFFCSENIIDRVCSRCSRRNPTCRLEYLIGDFFRQGYQYSLILELLAHIHNIEISDRTLRTILSSMNLRRRNSMNVVTDGLMREAIRNEISVSQNSGYRGIWTRLSLSYGLSVPRRYVMDALREINPARSAARRRRRLHRRTYASPGPNYVWHIDGISIIIILVSHRITSVRSSVRSTVHISMFTYP